MSDSVGQTIDAKMAVLEAKVAVIEATAKTDFAKAKAWAKTNWAHIVLTWPAAVSVLVPVVKALLKL